MADGRMLKRKITKSKKFAALKTDKARLLWLYMLPFTDVDGRIEADCEDIRDEIIRKQRKGYSLDKIESCLQDLHRVGLIALYSCNGRRYLEYAVFDKEQKNRNRDREAKSEIPPPTRGEVSEQSQRTPIKLSKVKLSLSEDNKSIFDHWNSKKKKGNSWRSHNELSPEIAEAIEGKLKKYSASQIKAAIDNYAQILLSKEFVWSYSWTLRLFLTRSRKDQRGELQLYRFLGNNFSEADFEKTTIGKQRAEVRKGYSEKIRTASAEKLVKARRDNEHKNMWFLIDELRPEIEQQALKE